MLRSIILATVIFTSFIGVGAVVNSFTTHRLVSVRSFFCVLLGALLGIPVSAWMFDISTIAGYVGMGLSIGLMYVLFFSGVINAIIQRIPAARRIVRGIFHVLRIVLIVAVIVGAVVGVLTYIVGL